MIPLALKDGREQLIAAAYAPRRHIRIEDGKLYRCRQHPPRPDSIREPTAEPQFRILRLPPDVRGVLQIIGMDPDPDAEPNGVPASQLHGQ